MEQLTKPNSAESLIPLVIADVASIHTKRVYTAELRRFFAWCEVNQVSGFNRQTVLDYRNNDKRGPVSVRLSLSAIRKLASQAADAGLMDTDVASGIVRVTGPKMGGKTRLGNWLNLEELKMLLAAPPPTSLNRGLRDRTALWLMGTCGLRRDEAAGLQLKNLQMRDGRPALVDFRGKGNKLRTVPIHHLADTAIRGWLDHAGIVEPEAFILPTVKIPDSISTEQADGARLYDCCRRYCAAYGGVWRPHDLRRSFALLAKKGGADIDDIRIALGHADSRTTHSYLAAPMSFERAAADRIDL